VHTLNGRNLTSWEKSTHGEGGAGPLLALRAIADANTRWLADYIHS